MYQDDTGGALGAASGAELVAGRDVNVWNAALLAQNGDVADNVEGGDVAGKDAETASEGRGRREGVGKVK